MPSIHQPLFVRWQVCYVSWCTVVLFAVWCNVMLREKICPSFAIGLHIHIFYVFCFAIHVHINSFFVDTCSPVLQVFKLSQWSSWARCSSGMLYDTTGWFVPGIVGHDDSPIFKGWKSSEEYHKRWLVQRYLLDTHPPTSTSTWTLAHIPILPADMLCSSPWYMGPEPHVMGRATWCAGVKMMGTARSRFDGCLTLRRLMSYIYICSTHSWCF